MLDAAAVGDAIDVEITPRDYAGNTGPITSAHITLRDSSRPGGFTCGPPATEIQPDPLDRDPDEPADVLPPPVCPLGQEPQPLPYAAPKGLLGRTTARQQHVNGCDSASEGSSAFYCYAGYSHTYTAAFDETPIDGSRAVLSVHAPAVDPNDAGAHSVSEIALSDEDDNTIEVGWIVDSGETQPRLFAFCWVDGTPQGYNVHCTPYANAPRQLDSVLPVTSATSGKTLGLRHSDASNRWIVYYGSRAVCHYDDVLWGASQHEFDSATLAQWFGEVATVDHADGPCSQMGNGRRGTVAGSARFRRVRVIHGTTASTVPETSLNNDATVSNTIYRAKKLGDGAFRYGGPSASPCS